MLIFASHISQILTSLKYVFNLYPSGYRFLFSTTLNKALKAVIFFQVEHVISNF